MIILRPMYVVLITPVILIVHVWYNKLNEVKIIKQPNSDNIELIGVNKKGFSLFFEQKIVHYAIKI